MHTNKYQVTILDVVDGDTVDVDIHLGFGIRLEDERIRIKGIDAPESRTSDSVEKLFGLAAKKRVQELLGQSATMITIEDKHGEDMKGKYGRILGDFEMGDKTLAEILVEEGYAVAYNGGNKKDYLELHIKNREKLLSEGIVSREEYDAAVLKESME